MNDRYPAMTFPGGYTVEDIEAMDRFDAFEAGMNAGKDENANALKTLREIHFFLYPELYGNNRAGEHGFYDYEQEVYEWNADTIEGVAAMVTRALADDPATPNGDS